MKRKIHKVTQRTEDWYRLKWGRITSTGSAGILTKGKDPEGLGATMLKTCHKIVAEHKTSFVMPDNYISTTMEQGIMLEPDAIHEYENTTFREVKEVGFVSYGDYFGDSPDGHVGKDGCIEVKCPSIAVHESYLYTNKIDPAHIDQIDWHMFIGYKSWCDWISYNPFFPVKEQLLIIRAILSSDKRQELGAKSNVIKTHLDKRLGK